MRQAITLLEKMIESNSLEMKIIAFEHIESTRGDLNLKERFQELKQQNIALEKAVDELLFSSDLEV